MGDFAVNLRQQRGPQAVWGHKQLAIVGLIAIPCENVEQLADISGDSLICSEESQVNVGECAARMIVAGAHMDVASDDVILLPHDDERLGMDFQPVYPVDDMHSMLF